MENTNKEIFKTLINKYKNQDAWKPEPVLTEDS